MLSEWAVMADGDALYINSYECADYVTEDGVEIQISSQYPLQGKVSVTVKGYTGRLCLRIPAWSKDTEAADGAQTCKPAAGQFWTTECAGEKRLVLQLDFSTRYLRGELEFDGRCSVYRGPVLFGTDTSLLVGQSVKNLPAIDRTQLEEAPSCPGGDAIRIPLANGVTLGDFYHLGQTGAEYVTWLPVSEKG